MTQVDDLSSSLAAFDQNTSLVVVIEMSEASWLVAGLVFDIGVPVAGEPKVQIGTNLSN